jgi:hypothetical protein
MKLFGGCKTSSYHSPSEPSSPNEVSPSCKIDSEGALMSLFQWSLMREVRLHRGNFSLPSSCIPNSSSSQARFNPDEPNMRLMWSRLPRKHHPHALGLELHGFSCMGFLELCLVKSGGFGKQALLCFFFYEKAWPSSSSAWMPKHMTILTLFIWRLWHVATWAIWESWRGWPFKFLPFTVRAHCVARFPGSVFYHLYM